MFSPFLDILNSFVFANSVCLYKELNQTKNCNQRVLLSELIDNWLGECIRLRGSNPGNGCIRRKNEENDGKPPNWHRIAFLARCHGPHCRQRILPKYMDYCDTNFTKKGTCVVCGDDTIWMCSTCTIKSSGIRLSFCNAEKFACHDTFHSFGNPEYQPIDYAAITRKMRAEKRRQKRVRDRRLGAMENDVEMEG